MVGYMRSQIGHQETTESWIVYDTVESFKPIGMCRSPVDTRLSALKLNDQLRQKQQNTMGGRMVA